MLVDAGIGGVVSMNIIHGIVYRYLSVDIGTLRHHVEKWSFAKSAQGGCILCHTQQLQY